MKLKSCLSPMFDNDEMDNEKLTGRDYYYKSSTKTTTAHHCKNKKNNFSRHNNYGNESNICCPKCSRVVDEYKQTRMSIIRQKYGDIDDENTEISAAPVNHSESELIETIINDEINNINNSISTFDTVNSISSVENCKDDVNSVQIRQVHRFDALDVATGIPEIPSQRSSNRLTNSSTRSNSDSLLERNSKDFRAEFQSLSNSNLENTNKIVNTEEKSDVKSNKALDVIKEIIETERNYVESLRCIVEEYIPELQRKDIIQGLRGQKFSLFCNVEKIYDFHKNIFMKDLLECINDWTKIGNCFLKHEKKFELYVLYNKNKPKSDALMADYGYFFEEKRRILNHPLNLSSQLLEPVQRLTRYTLLLDKLLKECDIDCHAYKNLFNAREMIVYTLRHGDDLLYMDGIKNCDINLDEQGKLLRQERFLVIEENVKKPVEHRLFLFEDLILFSIPSKLNKNEYNYRLSWKMTDVGITDYGDQTKFIIWFRKYQKNRFLLDAINSKTKMEWVQEINSILWRQATHYKLAKEKELAALGINQTRIPIQEEESDEDERTSNKKYYSTRSLRGVAGEIKPKKVLDRTTWYCTIRTDEIEES